MKPKTLTLSGSLILAAALGAGVVFASPDGEAVLTPQATPTPRTAEAPMNPERCPHHQGMADGQHCPKHKEGEGKRCKEGKHGKHGKHERDGRFAGHGERGERGPRGGHGRPPMAKMFAKVGVTEQQQAAIDAVFAANKPQKQALRQQQRQLHQSFEALDPTSADYAAEVSKLAEQRAVLAAQEFQLMATTRQQVAQLLTDEQRAQLKAMQAQRKAHWEAKRAERQAKRAERKAAKAAADAAGE